MHQVNEVKTTGQRFGFWEVGSTVILSFIEKKHRFLKLKGKGVEVYYLNYEAWQEERIWLENQSKKWPEITYDACMADGYALMAKGIKNEK